MTPELVYGIKEEKGEKESEIKKRRLISPGVKTGMSNLSYGRGRNELGGLYGVIHETGCRVIKRSHLVEMRDRQL